MKISLRLTETVPVIVSKINTAIASEMNTIMRKKRTWMLHKFSELVGIWVRSQPEILSLYSKSPASLSAQFGIPFGSTNSAIAHIVESVQNSTNIRFTKFDSKLRGGVFLEIQPENFSHLLSLHAGHVHTEKGTDLHWLRWLLERGTEIIVVGYYYTPNDAPDGRSGGGTMGKGSAWRVPTQFAGTKENNFITRAFIGKERDIAAVFHRALTR
jgi:hypothetical protein